MVSLPLSGLKTAGPGAALTLISSSRQARAHANKRQAVTPATVILEFSSSRIGLNAPSKAEGFPLPGAFLLRRHQQCPGAKFPPPLWRAPRNCQHDDRLADKTAGVAHTGSRNCLISKERPPRHNHAAGQQRFDGSVEPKNRHAGGTQKFRTARLRVRAATQSQHGAFFEFRGSAEGGAQLLGLHLTKFRFAEPFEKFRYGKAGGFFNARIEVNKAPRQLTSQQRPDSSLAGAHKACQA